MSYQLGIDLGTTFTAAAIHRDDRATICSLGGRAASIPSVVHLREDGTVLTGDAAVRRAVTEPERVAREFKRRLGDTTPIIVGGTPYSAEALMARLLRSVVDEVEKREGAAPSRIAISHPANWGDYKLDLFKQAIQLADLDVSAVQLLTEPEAAAISYASQERVEVGEVVAVYDLGGGTFDAAMLRRTVSGFEIIGKPEGIERLGGIDFDAAVSAHVARALDGALSELDPDDPTAVSAMARLRQDCVDAKEGLSSDTDAVIPVLLPNVQTEVRITRREFEALIRPSLVDSIEAMRRAVRSAGIEMSDVSRVLLVGGSSRVPLIAQLVSSELGRPVAVDAHPKHAVALGAAFFAASNAGPEAIATTIVEPPASAPAAPKPAASASAPQEPKPAAPAPASPSPSAAETAAPKPASSPTPTPAPERVASNPAPAQAAPAAAGAASTSTPATPSTPATSSAPSSTGSGNGSRTGLLVGLGALVLALGVGAFALLPGGGDEGETATSTTVSNDDTEPTVALDEADEPDVTEAPATTEAPVEVVDDAVIEATVLAQLAAVDDRVSATVADGVVTLTGRAFDETNQDIIMSTIETSNGVVSVDNQMELQAADEQCTETIKANERYACLFDVVFDGEQLTASFESSSGPQDFAISSTYHMHVFSDVISPEMAGAAGDASVGGGTWKVWDAAEGFVAVAGDPEIFVNSEVPTRLCVRIATPDHTLDSLRTGTCWPVEDISAQ